jgi:hypothetical protein
MDLRDAFLRSMAIVASCAALFGAVVGWVAYAMAASADGNSDGSVSTETTLQFILGWAGIVPVAAMAYLVFTRSTRKATVAFAIGLIVWMAWIVLNDAAIHGWDDDMTIVGLFR